jgi:hypothetical protein
VSLYLVIFQLVKNIPGYFIFVCKVVSFEVVCLHSDAFPKRAARTTQTVRLISAFFLNKSASGVERAGLFAPLFVLLHSFSAQVTQHGYDASGQARTFSAAEQEKQCVYPRDLVTEQLIIPVARDRGVACSRFPSQFLAK